MATATPIAEAAGHSVLLLDGVAEDISMQTFYDKIEDVYYMHYKNMADSHIKVLHNEAEIINGKFGSDDVIVSKDELKQILKSFNYFRWIR